MKKDTKVISLQLSTETYHKLKLIAAENEQPVQGLVRSLIKQYLRSIETDDRAKN